MDNRLLNAADVAARLNTSVRSAQKIMRLMRHINIGLGKKNMCLRVTEESLLEYQHRKELDAIDSPVGKKAKVTKRNVSTSNTLKIPRR